MMFGASGRTISAELPLAIPIIDSSHVWHEKGMNDAKIT
jgi:hypothetical protein